MDGNQSVFFAQGALADRFEPLRLLPELRPEGAFCSHEFGWAPLNPLEWGLSPCFFDAVLAGFAGSAVLAALAGYRHVSRFQKRPGVRKNAVYYIKFAVIFAYIAAQISLALAHFLRASSAFDIQVWAPIALAASSAAVAVVQYAEFPRMRYPTAVPLLYWFFLVFLSLNHVYLVRTVQPLSSDSLIVNLVYGLAGLSLLELVLEWLVPINNFRYAKVSTDSGLEESPMEYATVFSVIFFSWMDKLFRTGYNKPLEEEDLYDLPHESRAVAAEERFLKIYDEAKKTCDQPSVWLVILKTIWLEFTYSAVFKLGNDIMVVGQPILLRYMIRFLSEYRNGHRPKSPMEGFTWAILMFAGSLFQTICFHQYCHICMGAAVRIGSAMRAAIYRKTLRSAFSRDSNVSTGQLINLISVDIERPVEFLKMSQILWSSPFQIVTGLFLLYRLIGVHAFAGFAGILLMIPLNYIWTKCIEHFQRKVVIHRDNRVRLITELLTHIKTVKLYAWDSVLQDRVTHVRNGRELPETRKMAMFIAIQSAFWSVSSIVVSCLSFGSFVLSGGKLTPDIIFPALALFNQLNFPLAALPMVITAYVDATVSIQKIQKFLASEELQHDAVEKMSDSYHTRSGISVEVSSLSSKWSNDEEDTEVIKDLSFSMRPGDFYSVIGKVGVGKSSLLRSLIGDLIRTKGKVSIHGSVAYVAQTNWILNGTIKDNILFGKGFNAERYVQVLTACALGPDLKILPDGDATNVGERGLSLSGGQKARVALARAVYADADVYIFDDILSAVDARVSELLVNKVLGPDGILKNKTRILATNHLPAVRVCSKIILMPEGIVVDEKSYMSMENKIMSIMAPSKAGTSSGTGTPGEPAMFSASRAVSDGESSEEEGDSTDEVLAASRYIIKADQSSSRAGSKAVVARPEANRHLETDLSRLEQGSKEQVEDRGSVSWGVYVDYVKAANPVGVFFYFFFLAAGHTFSLLANYWLKQWGEIVERGDEYSPMRQLFIYSLLGVIAALMFSGQSLTLWIGCIITASKKLHQQLLGSVIRAPMSFFEQIPLGTILNRFSNDISKIDSFLPRTVNAFFAVTGRVVVTLVVISIATPAFYIAIIPIMFVYVMVLKFYLPAGRELRRLKSTTLSPVYSFYGETLTGQSTIRAFGLSDDFMSAYLTKTDNYARTDFLGLHSNRWLGMRTEGVGSLVILSIGVLSVIGTVTGTGASPGMIGLALSYGLQITAALAWMVRQIADAETNFVAVERIVSYIKAKPEAPTVVEEFDRRERWPTKGAITISNYSTRYRDDLDLVLKGINLDIEGGEKIGIVGRTGAGKSSFILSLFRIIEAAEDDEGNIGKIVIDGQDISKLGLWKLRSSMAIIPQDSSLFQGTIRKNLDPQGVYEDAALLAALNNSKFTSRVIKSNETTDPLSMMVGENGSGLSHGQRQLLSLARALLADTSIVLLDEATSSIDPSTDKEVQEILQSSHFKDKTVITIAHRLDTILKSDRIVVLEQGQVAEVGSPEELAGREDGIFADMARRANVMHMIQGVGAPKL